MAKFCLAGSQTIDFDAKSRDIRIGNAVELPSGTIVVPRRSAAGADRRPTILRAATTKPWMLEVAPPPVVASTSTILEWESNPGRRF